MSDDEANIPDRDTCQKLTEEFAAITQTNEALAQTFLQDHKWELGKSISAFYDALNKEQKTIQKLFGKGKCVTSEPPSNLKLLSWNLDGLDGVNLKKRTRAVIGHIAKHEPDIVFFQEVVPDTAEYLEKKLPEYKCIRGNDEQYFTMTLLRQFTIFYVKHEVINFESSMMGRNLLKTEATMGQLKLQLLNMHLESGAEHSIERKNQLKIAFDEALKLSPVYTVVLGGDMNLRNAEATVPVQYRDLWEYCGSPNDFKYTWDMTKNTNHSNFGKFKPRCRFDRLYFKFGDPPVATPKVFALTGFEKAPQTQSFPSDHWGVVVIFDLDHSLGAQ